MRRIVLAQTIPHSCILLLALSAMPGCLVVQVGVTNPIPDLSTVAVVPFFNQSSEPAQVVDGRRFAIAYATELQKVPGFQVLPVGVTETAIARGRLDLNRPGDVLRLAELLDVDAVVVGSVTHYDPYYPPRIGMHVDWYSRDESIFRPGVPVIPVEKPGLIDRVRCWFGDDRCEACEEPVEIRGQSPEAGGRVANATAAGQPSRSRGGNPIAKASHQSGGGWNANPSHLAMRARDGSAYDPIVEPPVEPLPLMSYTRMFDGANSDLQAALRDYYEFQGDERSGGWQAYLQRSDDFIRFTSQMMIVEMLMLHGGEAQRKYVVKRRKAFPHGRH